MLKKVTSNVENAMLFFEEIIYYRYKTDQKYIIYAPDVILETNRRLAQ
jgi:hypothetical protein